MDAKLQSLREELITAVEAQFASLKSDLISAINAKFEVFCSNQRGKSAAAPAAEDDDTERRQEEDVGVGVGESRRPDEWGLQLRKSSFHEDLAALDISMERMANKSGKINLAATRKDLMEDEKQGDVTIDLYAALDMEAESVTERSPELKNSQTLGLLAGFLLVDDWLQRNLKRRTE